MSGKFIVNAIAVVGWLIASLIAYAIVVLAGFFGIGLMGLLIVFAATQFELNPDGPAPSGIKLGFCESSPQGSSNILEVCWLLSASAALRTTKYR